MSGKGIVCVVTGTAVVLAFANFQQLVAQGRRGGIVMRGPQGVNDIAIAHNAAVEKEVGIKPDQKEKIDDLFKDAQEEETAAFDFQSLRDLAPEERQKKMAELGAKMSEVRKRVNEKFLPKLKEVLDATQLKRVHEIAIQAAGANALLDAGVQSELKITSEQKDNLNSIIKDFQNPLAERRLADRTTKMQELNEEQLAKSTEVLTKDQQAQFASMKGKPFDVKLLRPQGRGGRRPRPAPGGPLEPRPTPGAPLLK